MTLVFVLSRDNQWPWLQPIYDAARAAGHHVIEPGEARADRVLTDHHDAVAVSVLGLAERSAWRGPWIGIQHRVTDLLFLADPSRYARIAVWSPAWIDAFARYRKSHAAAEARVGPTRAVEALRTRALVSGATLADGARSRQAARDRFSALPERFVVYLPIPRHSAERMRGSFLCWPWETEWWIVRQLRRACDRAGLGLIIKGRAKNRIPWSLAATAGAVLDDDQGYEPTLLRLLEAGAVRLFHWMSCGVVEAAIANVPSVCFTPLRENWAPYAERRAKVPMLEPLSGQPGFFGGWSSVLAVEARDAAAFVAGAHLLPLAASNDLPAYRAAMLGAPGAGTKIVAEIERAKDREAPTCA